MIKKIAIRGLRGFATWQYLNPAMPNNQMGSGLTIFVGANNSGKSTIIEGIRALSQDQPPSITEGRRNRSAGDKIDIWATDESDRKRRLRSLSSGRSATRFDEPTHGNVTSNVFLVPSRRTFKPHFNEGGSDRDHYSRLQAFPTIRASTVDQFSRRLFKAEEHQAEFNLVLGKVLSPVPKWSIDHAETGLHYLKITSGNSTHSSEGLGEGLVSLFFLIDALYDSKAGDTIVIDEPELSLHPHLQRRLSQLLAEYAADRQIIVSTHSPYMVNTGWFASGMALARVHKTANKSSISQLSETVIQTISKLQRDTHNPHILGLKAQEVFFMEGGIVLFEGQEDVIYLEKVLTQLGVEIEGSIFGWGVGGASNMIHVSAVLRDLGFSRVAGILDNDESSRLVELKETFPQYHFDCIPADDIRTKQARPSTPQKRGLLDEKGMMRPEYSKETRSIVGKLNQYLTTGKSV